MILTSPLSHTRHDINIVPKVLPLQHLQYTGYAVEECLISL